MSVDSAMTRLTPVSDRSIDDVLGAEDVRLDSLERVVLGSRDLLERRGMDDDVDVLERTAKARLVADVPDEVPHLTSACEANGSDCCISYCFSSSRL